MLRSCPKFGGNPDGFQQNESLGSEFFSQDRGADITTEVSGDDYTATKTPPNMTPQKRSRRVASSRCNGVENEERKRTRNVRVECTGVGNERQNKFKQDDNMLRCITALPEGEQKVACKFRFCLTRSRK